MTARRIATASNQPQRRGRPVTAPNSCPTRERCSPVSSNSSVGNGPAPTRVVYAFTMPSTALMSRGPRPVPTAASPAMVFDDVTNGYVPTSTSSSAPCAPSNIRLVPRFISLRSSTLTSASSGSMRSAWATSSSSVRWKSTVSALK